MTVIIIIFCIPVIPIILFAFSSIKIKRTAAIISLLVYILAIAVVLYSIYLWSKAIAGQDVAGFFPLQVFLPIPIAYAAYFIIKDILNTPSRKTKSNIRGISKIINDNSKQTY